MRTPEVAYRLAVDLLLDIGFMTTDAEYLRLKASVDDARYDLEVARQKFERAEHTGKRTAGSGAA